ncbi:hypothetical protein HDV00_006562 [Rhizophlyctis rosea]|nr:hypothetical protein HDV00_006562 [Rhizophlyctis rosea]
MATLGHLPELVVPIFANASVPTLLTCERVCKKWSAVIRTAYVEQVWKPKLVDAYPEGCVPGLRGNENWRDLALVSFAWGRPWVPRRVKKRLEELGHETMFDRSAGGVVRDVTNSDRFAFRSSGDPKVLAFYDSGEVIYSVIADGRWSWFRPPDDVYVDSIFTNPHIRPGKSDNIATHTRFIRTSIVARQSRDYPTVPTFAYEDYKTGSILAVRPIGPNETICGDYIVQHDPYRSRQLRYPARDTLRVQSLRDPSYRLRIHDCTCMCFNENVLAYTTSSPSHTNEIISIIRLKDQEEIGEFTMNRHEDFGCRRPMSMNRFNLFIAVCGGLKTIMGQPVGKIFVLDFYGNHLYSLELPEVKLPYEANCAAAWDREFLVRDASTRTFMVFDAVDGMCRRIRGPCDTKVGRDEDSDESGEEDGADDGGGNGKVDSEDHDGEKDDVEQGGEEVAAGHVRKRRKYRWKGYAVTVMEYAVDDTGKRTGAGGALKYYWRWVE